MSKHNVSRDFTPFQCDLGFVIPLTQHQFTIVDLQDEWVCQFNWCAHWFKNTKSFYCSRRENNKLLLLHREIINPEPQFFIDHINHDTLDNRRENLRVVTHSENSMNRVISSNNSTGITGVCFVKQYQKFRARITIKNKRINLGYFDTLEEATIVRHNAEIKYFGKYRLSPKN